MAGRLLTISRALSQAIKSDLASLQENVMRVSKGIIELQISQKVLTRLPDQETRLRDQESQEIVAWLSSLSFSTKQNDVFNARQEDTGQWFLDSDAFKSWTEGIHKTLWCPGIPGAGKTVLSSIVVDHLRSISQGGAAVACIYCNYKEQEEQTITHLIACLARQLIQRRSVVPEELNRIYRTHIKGQSRPSLNECIDLLESQLGFFSRVFLVIDALDELQDNDGSRTRLITEIQKLQPTVHLMVTSRHDAGIERLFDPENVACIEILASDRDIKRYLESQFWRGRLKRNVGSDTQLRDVITDTIVANAEGMFLLARLHMEILARKVTRRDLKAAIKTLPKELDSVYDEAIQRIWNQDEEDVRLAKQALSWISFARRPLQLPELQHALAIELDDTDLDKDALPDGDIPTSVCAGLVTIDKESNIIRLAHYTTQEYFERISTNLFPETHTAITRTCLTYLSFDKFSDDPTQSGWGRDDWLQENPLLDYAANHWGRHACGTPEQILESSILNFFEQDSKLLHSVRVMQDHWTIYAHDSHPLISGLWLAAHFGMERIVRVLLGRGVNINTKTKYGETPLHRASAEGHEAVVQVLLSKGADANARIGAWQLPSLLAAKRGHGGVVKRLLEASCQVNAKDEHGWTMLHWAAKNGHRKLVQFLIQKGADISAGTDDDWTPLHVAVGDGQELVVQLLLDAGADINLNSRSGGSMMMWAAARSHERVARLLAENGADIDSKANNGRTPLMAAADSGHEGMARLLLGLGADVNASTVAGATVLYWAASNGHRAVAAYGGSVAIVQLLLEAGALVDARGDGRPPMYYAAFNGHDAVVRLLLDGGADPNAADGRGESVLMQAAQEGSQTITRTLLEAGAAVDSRDGNGRTPLFLAARYGYLDVVKLPIEHGADYEAKTDSGRTLLDDAMINGTSFEGHDEVVKFLKSRPARRPANTRYTQSE
ncbi:MAG: hypothetical protein M1813_006067 [Trichoglossum hirsutum]|nr:MAG: hypothetical protein M1813_006067 [Trichoglossum hirsutum]